MKQLPPPGGPPACTHIMIMGILSGLAVKQPLTIIEMQIVSMEDEMTMPEGWGTHTPPPAAPSTDASIYELHIRDFRYCHAL